MMNTWREGQVKEGREKETAFLYSVHIGRDHGNSNKEQHPLTKKIFKTGHREKINKFADENVGQKVYELNCLE